ncbi:MAG: DUF4956 domain-containing protein [Myxococcota bacterium]
MASLLGTLLRNIVARLMLYYAAVLLAFTGVFRAFPQISSYVNAERLRGEGVSLDLDPNQIVTAGEQAQRAANYTVLDPYTSIPVIFALLSVMALTIPVAWVYRWTRHPARYSPSIAHALLVLPLAITLVVFLVKGSLALAFSLAGIVAAVRFRTALSESEDAVYMFVVIGIGLAAGVQLTNVAFIASVFFNFVSLFVRYLNFGVRPALLNGWSLVPDEEEAPVPPEPAAVLTADVDKARYNTRLRLPTTDVERSQKAAMPLLDNAAKAWRFAQVSVDEGGRSVVEFDARLRGSVDVAGLARDLEDSTLETGRVEVKKIKKDKMVDGTTMDFPVPSLVAEADGKTKKKVKKKDRKGKGHREDASSLPEGSEPENLASSSHHRSYESYDSSSSSSKSESS